MRIIYWVLLIVGVCFCVGGFMGHTAAWGGSALSFFAVAMIKTNNRKK